MGTKKLVIWMAIAVLSVFGTGLIAVGIMFNRIWHQQMMLGGTTAVIDCIVSGGDKYFAAHGAYPENLDEYIKTAVSDEFCAEPACSGGYREDVLARRDAWGRPLQFEFRPLDKGLVEVTVISCGEDGERDYVASTSQSDNVAHGDDIARTFYLSVPRVDPQ